jgi:hypothetical protein
MKIATNWPHRWSWKAVADDTCDSARDGRGRNQIGAGVTESEAMRDLLEQLVAEAQCVRQPDWFAPVIVSRCAH